MTSGPSTQTVSASTAITSVNYLVSTNCTDTTTVNATGLPPGVTMNYTSSSGAVVISGTPSGNYTSAASGTFNYSILAMFAPTCDATASATISGTISIAASTASSTTVTPCSGSIGLTSGPGSQTVSATTAIADIEYRVYTNCIDTTTVSATGLPLGVTMNYDSSSGNITVSGTPTGTTSGTYSYTILAMFAPTSDATASATTTGSIIVTDASISYIINVTASNLSLIHI